LGGGFCFFTGHDTRADPLKFAQHGERMHIWDDGSSSDLAFRQKARRITNIVGTKPLMAAIAA